MKETISARYLEIEKARDVILSTIQKVDIEQAGIINAYGRTLAEDIVSVTHFPNEDIALIDGYAAISSDTNGANEKNPRRLSVLSESVKTNKSVEPGTVIRIRKGEPLPQKADTVVKSSDAYRPEDGPEVLILREYNKNENVQKAGAIFPSGEILIHAGTPIQGVEMGILASLGLHGVQVTKKPRISVITTGEGIVEILHELNPGETRNWARYMLVGMILQAGCELGRLIHISDGSRISLEKVLCDNGSCDATIVVIGPNDKHDLAVLAVENVGFIHFTRINMEPGASTAFGTIGGKPVFITSSDSLLEVFEMIIRPGLMKMLGRNQIFRSRITAKIGASLKLNPGCTHCYKAVTKIENDEPIARPILPNIQNVNTWTIPNSIITIPAELFSIKRGEKVEVALLY